MTDLILFGAGEIAELAHFYFTREGKHRVCAFVVDDAYHQEDTFCGLPVVPFSRLSTSYPPDRYKAFVAMSYAGMNQVRREKYEKMKALGYQLVSYVSPDCTNLAEKIGENCFILEDNTLQPFVRIGNNVTLWSGNHIGHHSRIEDHNFITSHVVVSGGVTIGSFCFIGVNATLRDHISLGEASMIGAGAIVTKSTSPKAVLRAARTELLEITSDAIKKI